MKRRGFLAALAASLTLDPERALWVPGAKLISVPKPVPLPVSGISLMREMMQLEYDAYCYMSKGHLFYALEARANVLPDRGQLRRHDPTIAAWRVRSWSPT